MSRILRPSSAPASATAAAAAAGVSGRRPLLLTSWSAFRRGLQSRRPPAVVVVNAAPQGDANWRAAEWAPAQPAIVFGGGGGAQEASAVDAPSLASASSRPPSPSPDRAPAATTPQGGLFRIAVYTKPGCPLCDNLADRAQALLDRAAFLPGGGPLGQAGVDVSRAVERRDVSAPPPPPPPAAAAASGSAKAKSGVGDWARLHAGQVPVLVLLRGGGEGEPDYDDDEEEEVAVPRPPPRVTADKLERHLAAAASEAREAREPRGAREAREAREARGASVVGPTQAAAPHSQ